MFFDRFKLFGTDEDEPDDSGLVVDIPMKWYSSPVEFTVDWYEIKYGYAHISRIILSGTTEYGEEIEYECDDFREAEIIADKISAYEEGDSHE